MPLDSPTPAKRLTRRRHRTLSIAMALLGTVIAAPAVSQPPPPVTRTRPAVAPQQVSTAAQQQVTTVPVPDLIGDDVRTALSKLRPLGLQANLTGTPLGSRPSGTVVRQSPGAKTPVPRGSTITLYLRPAQVMPLVRGLLESDARTKLGSFTIAVDVSYRDTAESRLHNVVAQQKPDSGAPVRPQQSVALLVYRSVAPTMVVVPHLISDDVPTAIAKLRSVGLQPGLPGLPSTALSTGIVSAQWPDPGSRVPTATTVKLAIRPALIDVPSVVGSRQNDGEWAITSRGLRVGSIYSSFSDIYAAGVIAAQTPTPPAQLQSGQGVDLTVSSGPHPQAPTVRVPDLFRLPIGAAADSLRRVGLALARPTVRVDAAHSGLVISQQPAPHSIAHEGDTVRLIIGIVQPTVMARVPSVTGLDRSLAERIVRDSGFTPVTTVSPSDSATTGRVVAQAPTAGTPARRGSSVGLSVRSPVNLQLADSALVRVPLFVGRSLRDASVLADLAELNLTLGTTVPDDSSLTIAQQSPAADSLVPPNSTVLVVLTGGIGAWWWAIPLGLAALAGTAVLAARTRPRTTAGREGVEPAAPRVRLASPDISVAPHLESKHDPLVAHHVALIDQPVESRIDHELELIVSTEDISSD